MTAEHFLAFNIALLAAIASPGPALLVAIRMSLSAGRIAGVAVGCGLGLIAAMWTLMALLGLDAVFKLFPWAYAAAKTGAALYLLYIACQMWRSARQEIETQVKPVRHAFWQGVMINLLNPKSVLFAAAVLVVIFPPDRSLSENLLVALNHFAVEVLFYTGLALTMNTKAVSTRYLRAKVFLDRFASAVLGVLGLRLLAGR